jgi:hypothetical protein
MPRDGDINARIGRTVLQGVVDHSATVEATWHLAEAMLRHPIMVKS